ncbi:ATPase [Pseudomonas sp. RP23018S]|uniref:ATPase n=1 Tax=Pseudomonas sp. RP23018S TaxID=3096037 RepID=UPI002ACADA9B|nr:ATPase [Pseudomonas sp. RP23018S]MDZ5603431.1 ATPase [Pseudomonas sp. RP23018S]
MRNNEPDDFDNVPSLRAGTRDDDERLPTNVARSRQRAVRPASTGPLWALLGAACIALAGLGWWSVQQISLLEQQLVATQESFARISEDAAGRLQAISGKVAASESNVSNGSEALKAQLQQLQASLAEQGKQQEGVAGQAGDLGKRLEQVLADTRQQQQAVSELQSQLQAQLKAVNGELAALKSGQQDGGKLEGQVKSLSAEVATLKQQGNQKAALESLEQDVLVLKSQADNRPATPSASGASVQEFDAFRGQTTRTLNTLQSQVQNLQQQINARP